MRVSEKRHRIDIIYPETTLNGYGQEIKAYVCFARCWAKITSVTGKEYIQLAQVKGELIYNVNIHYTAGINNTMRVIHGKREFNIIDVLTDSTDKKEMYLKCSELTNG